MAYKKSKGRLLGDLFGKASIFTRQSDDSVKIDTENSGVVSSSTTVANTAFQSSLANTNAYIATKLDSSSYTTADVQSKAALANTNSYIASVSATERSALANTNSYIATKLDSSSYTTADVQSKAALANTNAYIASVAASAGSGDVSNSYITSTYTSNTVFQAFVANTNAYIASSSGGGSSATTFVEYTYTATASQQSFSGADDFGQSLDYTAEDISVYLNGILLVANTDYQAANTTSIWLVNPATADDTLQVQAFNATSIVNVTADVIANSATTSATTAHTIDSFPATTWRSAKYIVQMTSGSDYHATEALVLHDGTSAYVTEYGTIYTNASLGTVDADVNSGSVRLLVTPTNATTEVKVVRTGVAV